MELLEVLLSSVFLSLLLYIPDSCSTEPPAYSEKYINQYVDHFNYEIEDTYNERYFVSGTIHWNAGTVIMLL